jgi:hypothetical protein
LPRNKVPKSNYYLEKSHWTLAQIGPPFPTGIGLRVQLQFKGQCLHVTIKKVMVLVDSLFICKLIFFLVPQHDVKGEVREKAKIEGFWNPFGSWNW